MFVVCVLLMISSGPRSHQAARVRALDEGVHREIHRKNRLLESVQIFSGGRRFVQVDSGQCLGGRVTEPLRGT